MMNNLGIMGLIWTILWFSTTFEKPYYHPSITREEKDYIESKIGHVSQSYPTVCLILYKI